MALIKCKECGKEFSDKASKCIHCGTTDFLNSIEENENQEKNIEKESKKINDLKQELENAKIENLKKEIELEKKKAPKEKKNYFLIFINVIRYLIAILCSLGAIASLFSFKIFILLSYLIMALTFYPFIYNKLWGKVNVSTTLKIVIQIIAPIIGFILGSIFMTLGV